MKHRLVPLALALSLAGIVMTSAASAQTTLNNRTLLTFSQPVEVPGQVLPAGTYTFELHDSMSNRHIVQIFDEAGTKLLAIVLAIPNSRVVTTEETVITFHEVPAGQPQALRAWFYPNQTVGQEMAYSKTRAQALSATANAAVPAVDDSVYADAKADAMKTADIVSVTPEPKAPVAVVTEPVRPVQVDPAPVEPTRAAAPAPRRELPRTASPLPMLALFGFSAIAAGMAMRRLSARRAAR